MAPMARSPACAMPGPLTTCFRPSRSRASPAKKRASSPREELTPLAHVNVDSLKEYDFFTYASANGKEVEFIDPAEYLRVRPKETVLTLLFMLSLKAPVKTKAHLPRSL